MKHAVMITLVLVAIIGLTAASCSKSDENEALQATIDAQNTRIAEPLATPTTAPIVIWPTFTPPAEISENDSSEIDEGQETMEEASEGIAETLATMVPTITPTSTPALHCLGGIEMEIDRECPYEDRTIEVAFFSGAPGPQLEWNDVETAHLAFSQFLFGSALTETDHLNRQVTVDVLIHLENNVGNHNLPPLEFGSSNKTWLVDVSASEEILASPTNENDWRGNRYVAVLTEGNVVELLIEHSPTNLDPFEPSLDRYFFTVLDGKLIWLYGEENNSFDRAGISLYVGPTRCGEGGTCQGFMTHESPDQVFVWSRGDSGWATLVPRENVTIWLDYFGFYKLHVPELIKVR